MAKRRGFFAEMQHQARLQERRQRQQQRACTGSGTEKRIVYRPQAVMYLSEQKTAIAIVLDMAGKISAPHLGRQELWCALFTVARFDKNRIRLTVV